jgi:hypothetical protein
MKKENRTNPLDEIEFWFTNLPADTQQRLSSMANHFHIEEEIYLSASDEKLNNFLCYLDSAELSDREICARSLFVIKLIDFSLTGKRTVDDWDLVLSRLIAMKNRCQELGESTEREERSIANWENDKNQWLMIVESWEKLLASELSNENMMDWYFEPAFRKSKEL